LFRLKHKADVKETKGHHSLRIGHSEGDASPGRTHKKPKDLSTCESEECGFREGGDVYVTLMESDGVDPHSWSWSLRRIHESWSDTAATKGPEFM
jgi:hypothetical protein